MKQLEDFLKNASAAGLIQWELTGEEVKTSFGVKRGYKTTVNGFIVKTIVRARPKGFLKQGWGKGELASGIIVEKDGETVTLSDDPETIPGEEAEYIYGTVSWIQYWAENKDLVASLTRSLAQMFYK